MTPRAVTLTVATNYNIDCLEADILMEIYNYYEVRVRCAIFGVISKRSSEQAASANTPFGGAGVIGLVSDFKQHLSCFK